MKVVYLAVQEASKKWTMPIRNWKPALNRFMIEFEDHLISLSELFQDDHSHGSQQGC